MGIPRTSEYTLEGQGHPQNCLKTRLTSIKMPTDYFTYAYAAAVATGGVIGFFKKGSVPSLAAGLSFGGLLAMGAFQMSSDPRNIGVALATSTFLGGVMGFRAFQTGKFMPTGLVAVVSLLMVLRLLYRVYGPNNN